MTNSSGQLNAAREMLRRAKEDPFTSRYYGIPEKPTAQRAVYIGCAGLYFSNFYRDLAWSAPLFSQLEESLITRRQLCWNIFLSATTREIHHANHPNRRLP